MKTSPHEVLPAIQEITRFRCPICHTDYTTYDDADHCRRKPLNPLLRVGDIVTAQGAYFGTKDPIKGDDAWIFHQSEWYEVDELTLLARRYYYVVTAITGNIYGKETFNPHEATYHLVTRGLMTPKGYAVKVFTTHVNAPEAKTHIYGAVAPLLGAAPEQVIRESKAYIGELSSREI